MNHFDRFRIACEDFISLMARRRLLGNASMDTTADYPRKGFRPLSETMDACWERCQQASEAKMVTIRLQLRLRRAGSTPDCSCFIWLHYDLVMGFQVRRMTLIDSQNLQCQTYRFVKNDQIPDLATIESLLAAGQNNKSNRRHR